jgi:hypothetical protein
MATELQAEVNSLPAVDVVPVTVKVPYHLELATAALGASNDTTRSPARPTRTRSSPSSRRSPRMSANA